jgi:hypothetical protein
MKHVMHTLKNACTHNRLILSAVGVLLPIVVILFAFYIHQNQKPQDPLDVLWSGNYTKERTFWKKEIDKVGTEKAYEAFKLETNGKEFGIAHTLSHIMGELIYEKEGIKGIVVCDASFAFGCYHSFFGRAITDGGVESVPELDTLCVGKFGPKGLGCPHGIGHGLLGYLGDDALNKALDICNKLSWQGPIGGCSSGVFMEYNFHTMQSLKGVEPRRFDSKHPLYPCDIVNKKFAQACYFELPAWYFNSVVSSYLETGKLCSKVSQGLEMAACFKGLGNTIGNGTRYNSEDAIKECDTMPSNKGMLLCRAGASWAFFAEPTTRAKMKTLCDGLNAVDKEYCNKEAEIII